MLVVITLTTELIANNFGRTDGNIETHVQGY